MAALKGEIVAYPKVGHHSHFRRQFWDEAPPFMPPCYASTEQVCDFADGDAPAVRVKGSCRNCAWKSVARYRAGVEIPEWAICPQCECETFTGRGEFVSRDNDTLEVQRVKVKESVARKNAEAEVDHYKLYPPKPQKVTTKTVEVDPVRVDVTVDVKRGRWRRG